MAKRETGPAQPTIARGAGASESPPLTFTESAEPVSSRATSGAAAPANISALAKIDDSHSEIVKWDNGAEASAEVVKLTDDDPTPTDKPKPAAAPAPKPAKPAAEEAPADEEDATPVAAKPTAGADKRRQILESLDLESKRVATENRIKAEQDRAEAAEAKLAEFEKSPLGRKLATIAKQHGLSMDDLKDKLLIGADDVLDKEDAPAPVAKEDPKVAELLKWKADREKAEGDAKIAQSVDRVREMLKEADLPLIDAFDAHSRVLVKAHAGWVAGGKKGAVQDYVPASADLIEEELRAERPAAARRLYPAAATEETNDEADIPAPRPAPRPTMGKRQAARPGTKPAPLPMDPDERSQEIRRRFGW